LLSPHIVSELTRPGRSESAETPVARSGAVNVIVQAPDIATLLKDGYYARQRDGAIVGPLRALDPGGLYAYACDDAGWTADGRYDATSDAPHPRDLLRVLPRKA
jgi:hypothetical protein